MFPRTTWEEQRQLRLLQQLLRNLETAFPTLSTAEGAGSRLFERGGRRVKPADPAGRHAGLGHHDYGSNRPPRRTCCGIADVFLGSDKMWVMVPEGSWRWVCGHSSTKRGQTTVGKVWPALAAVGKFARWPCMANEGEQGERR